MTLPFKYKPAGIIKATKTGFDAHLVRFSSPDDRDLDGEWFSPQTYFMRNAGYPIKGAPVNIHHGMLKTFGSIGVGLFEFADEDEIGLAVRAVMKERDEYIDMLKEIGRVKALHITDAQLQRKADLAYKAVNELVTTVPLQMSGGFDVATWQVDEATHHIDQAGIVHGALTHQPADDENPIVAFKSLGEAFFLESDRKTFHMPTGDTARKGVEDRTAETFVSEGDKTKMNEDEIRQIAPEILNAYRSKMGETGSEDELDVNEVIRAAVDEYVDDMKQAGMDDEDKMTDDEAVAVAAAMEEDLKAEGDDEPEKQMDEDALEKAFIKALKKVRTEDRQRQQRRRAAFGKAADEATRLNTAPSRAGGSGRSIQVGENLKYAHLSAPEMALGIQLRLAPMKSQGIPARMDQVVSEPYIRTMIGKMNKHADSQPYGQNAKSSQQLELAMKANYHLKSLVPFKANELDASNLTAQGDEWVGEYWSTDLWERERFERHYDRMINKGMWVQTIPQGAETAYFPTEGSDPTAYTAPQAASVDATGRPETTININPFGTGRVSLTPQEIKIATSHTTILEEDSVIAIVQTVNRQLNEAALDTRDKLMVNGDNETGTTNINYDGATPPTGLQTPYYIASDGFRLTALAAGLDASNTLTLDQYRLTLAALDGELRQYYDRMCFMIDPTTEMASLALPEIATDDVRRTNATVTSGRILNIYGVDVLSNGFILQADTDGKITATGNVADRGTILLVYAPYWGAAYKRQITLETARDIYSGSNVYVMSMRVGFVARGSNAAVMSYNVATAAS